MRFVKGANGKTRLAAVPLREYKVLRWQLGALALGQGVTRLSRREQHLILALAVRLLATPRQTFCGSEFIPRSFSNCLLNAPIFNKQF